MKRDNKDSMEEIQEPYTQNERKESDKKRSVKSIVLEVLVYLVIIYACVYIIPTYVIQRTIVDGPSMENTLHDGENLLVEKISYRMGNIDRFDVIVFYPYGREFKEYYVKRVIGLPGETIQIKDNKIYINGEVLEENYGKNELSYEGIAEDVITIGEDEIFVLGDNREVSLDSRYEEVGLVSLDDIGGKVLLRIWPLNKFGTVE